MTFTMKFVRPLVAIGGLMLSAQAAQAQSYASTTPTIVLTTTGYTENFDTLASTGSTGTALPAGWRVREDGQNGNTTYSVGTGSSNTGDVYSFGATGSTERALGVLPSGNLTPTYFGAFFSNGLGATINALTIGYNGELYRNGTATLNQLLFSYSTNATSLADGAGTWTSVSALDFASPNTAPVTSTPISATISGLSILSGGSFAIRWMGGDVTNADDALAIDDVSLTATLAATSAVPEPASWAMMIAGFGIVGGSLRTTRRRAVAHA